MKTFKEFLAESVTTTHGEMTVSSKPHRNRLRGSIHINGRHVEDFSVNHHNVTAAQIRAGNPHLKDHQVAAIHQHLQKKYTK